jgi:hypothetical protein
LNPPLIRAADAYITDVHAFLRRQLEAHKSRDAVRVDVNELSDHVRSAGARSTGWINRAPRVEAAPREGLLRLSVRGRRP